MDNFQHKRATGLYYSRAEAEAAVRELKDTGYDMDRISVIAKDGNTVAGEETNKEIGNKADEGAATGAVTGGALGGLAGLLVGIGALAIPGIGPILLAGAEATAIATTLAGAGIGAAAGSLVGALIGLGIPEAKARVYSDRVERGSFLVMVTGTPAEIARVTNIMRRHGVEEFDVHDAPTPVSSNVTSISDRNMPVDSVDAIAPAPMPNPKIDPPYSNFNTPVESEIATPMANTDVPLNSDRNVLVEPVVPAPVPAPTPNKPNTDVSLNSDRNMSVDADNIKLYEERLVIDKEREKTGEVTVGKKIETETASVSVPVEKEYIVVEHQEPVNETAVNPSQLDFQDNEVARFDVYEESAEIEKQAFVREEVTIRKEVTQTNVEAKENIRREELEIEPKGDVIQH
jgi:uncharacterized protein (TIGR02271 family)